jgi:hypothetical protein
LNRSKILKHIKEYPHISKDTHRSLLSTFVITFAPLACDDHGLSGDIKYRIAVLSLVVVV